MIATDGELGLKTVAAVTIGVFVGGTQCCRRQFWQLISCQVTGR